MYVFSTKLYLRLLSIPDVSSILLFAINTCFHEVAINRMNSNPSILKSGIRFYATDVRSGIVLHSSKALNLSLNGSGHDGAISAIEWTALEHCLNGTVRSEDATPLFFEPAQRADDATTGTLFSTRRHSPGTDLTVLLTTIPYQETSPAIDGMTISFVAGALIATPRGNVPVETLLAGDLVMTQDSGPQPLVWTNRIRLMPEDLAKAPNQRPVRIRQGALGAGLPRRDVDISPHHRVLVTDAEGREYLISARHLMMAGVPGIIPRPGDEALTLIQIAFGKHGLVHVEGAPMESFFTGRRAIRALGITQRLGLIAKFPEIGHGRNPMSPARPPIRYRDYVQILRQLPVAGPRMI